MSKSMDYDSREILRCEVLTSPSYKLFSFLLEEALILANMLILSERGIVPMTHPKILVKCLLARDCEHCSQPWFPKI